MLRLSGLIYFGGRHYTCRYIADDGKVWFHDGATTGRVCITDCTARIRGWLATARSQSLAYILYELLE